MMLGKKVKGENVKVGLTQEGHLHAARGGSSDVTAGDV